jgi:hypothetical protein
MVNEVLGWEVAPGTFHNRDVVEELTGMYPQRVSGVTTHLKARRRNPLRIDYE